MGCNCSGRTSKDRTLAEMIIVEDLGHWDMLRTQYSIIFEGENIPSYLLLMSDGSIRIFA